MNKTLCTSRYNYIIQIQAARGGAEPILSVSIAKIEESPKVCTPTVIEIHSVVKNYRFVPSHQNECNNHLAKNKNCHMRQS